jgi:hypothetical protein
VISSPPLAPHVTLATILIKQPPLAQLAPVVTVMPAMAPLANVLAVLLVSSMILWPRPAPPLVQVATLTPVSIHAALTTAPPAPLPLYAPHASPAIILIVPLKPASFATPTATHAQMVTQMVASVALVHSISTQMVPAHHVPPPIPTPPLISAVTLLAKHAQLWAPLVVLLVRLDTSRMHPLVCVIVAMPPARPALVVLVHSVAPARVITILVLPLLLIHASAHVHLINILMV